MANGCCTTCKTVLTEENCSPSKFKLGYGHCRVCDASRSREAYKRSPKRIRVANCSFCNGLLGRVGESIEILSNTIGYLRKFKGDFMTTH
jgi:hypothetical protein